MKQIRSILCCLMLRLLFGSPLLSAQEKADARFEKLVKPFFAQHCTKCHSEKKHEGDLRLDTLEARFESPKVMGHWEEIMNRINSGDMPPDEEPRPQPELVSQVADWIIEQLRRCA